jgi:hypothetical protein
MTEFHFPGDDSIAGVQPLFFRVADRMRLEGYVSALVQDNMSLCMVSSHDAILDHYGKLLVARLREAAPHIGLEVCFPASAEALITRFNEVLQDYSIEDAMGAKFHNAPPKIWIVHDAGALPDNEIQLLARLVQHFPGANIRVVMLFNAASQKQKLLTAFGRRILNWEIEPPNPEQAEALLEQARAQGREGAVGALLRQIAPYKAPAPHPMALPPLVAEPRDEPPAPPPGPSPESDEGLPPAAPPKRSVWPWVLSIGALLLVCGLGVAFVYGLIPTGDKAVQELRNVLQGKPLSAEKAASAATPASAPLAAASEPAPPASGASAAVAAPVASAPVAAAAPKPPEEVETIVPSTPRAKATVAAAPEVAPEPKPVDDAQNAQNQAGQAWVRQMPAGTFLVQHTIVPSYAEAGNYLQAHANLKRARIVANYLPNQPGIMFSVVSGPFASLAEASAYAESGGVPKDPQIRSARFMKEQFSPSIAGAFGQKKAEVKR